jgi:hypothetical protein
MEWLFIGLSVIFALMAFGVLLYSAPEGYQDETGYHDGKYCNTSNMSMIVTEPDLFKEHPWAVVAQRHECGYILFGSVQAANIYNEGKENG